MTTSCLYKNHRISYEGACVHIHMTMNSLPLILIDDSHSEHEPLMIRVHIITLDQQLESAE
jgi:hypothetical protein